MEEISEIRKYELMVIISGEISEADFEKELEVVRKELQENSKGIIYEESWGKRDMFYKIKKQRRGYYAIFDFTAEPKAILEIRASVKLNPMILRHMLIILPENYEPTRYKTEFLKEEPKPEPKALVRAPKKRKITEEKAEAPSAIKPIVAGKEQEQQLEAVEKRLEKILENPDIDIK